MKCYPWNSTKQNIPNTPCICAWYNLIEQKHHGYKAGPQHKEASAEKIQNMTLT